MAAQTQGIQQLLSAEKRAADKINEARKRKAKRLKQAKEEAQQEIEKYRHERERQFKQYEAQHLGSKEDIAVKINKDTEIELQRMHDNVVKNKEKVIADILNLVCDIKPEIHKNLRLQNGPGV